VIRGGEPPLEEGLALEYQAVERTSGSKDTIEGVRAFLERRRPVFKGE
jgi:enoyl-CoA hydratase/carnithine racemase